MVLMAIILVGNLVSENGLIVGQSGEQPIHCRNN